MKPKTNLADIDFDFIDYRKNRLTATGAKAHFKFLVCEKLNIEENTFNKWVQRGRVPGAIQVQMIDLINDPYNLLPKIK